MARRYPCLALFALCVSCSNPEAEIAAHAKRGTEYLESNRFPEAIVEFKNVLQQDPRNTEARAALAQAHIALGTPADVREAGYHLEIVIDHEPKSVSARVRLAELYLKVGNNGEAAKHAKSALGLDPNNSGALVAMGRAHLILGNTEEALSALRAAAVTIPDAAVVHVLIGQALTSRSEYTSAKQSLDRALQLDPKFLDGWLALGDWAASQADVSLAEDSYRKALAVDAADSRAVAKISEFYGRSQKWGNAISVYQEAIKADPKSVELVTLLGNLYRMLGRFAPAVETYRLALALEPDSSASMGRLLETMLDAGDVDALERELKQIADKGISNPLAELYRSRILIHRSKYVEAIEQLKLLTSKQPQFGAARVELAKALIASGDRVGAAAELRDAANLPSHRQESTLLLSQLLLEQGTFEQALSAAKQVYTVDKNSPRAVIAYGNALAKTGHLREARGVFEQAALIHATDATLQHHIGVLARREGMFEAALTHFENAFRIDPTMDLALSEIVAIHLERNSPTTAIKRVESEMAGPNKRFAHLVLLGEIYEKQSNFVKAEQAYLDAMSLSPRAWDAQRRLSGMYFAQKQTQRATKKLTQTLSSDPNNVGAHVVLGILNHAAGALDSARLHYEAALKLNPKAAIPLNNLASILAEDSKTIDRALELSILGLRERPRDANVIDTVGWVYYKKGEYHNAVSLLGAANAAEPHHPPFLCHYGLALAAVVGSESEAKRALDECVTLSKAFASRADVNEALAKLNGGSPSR